MLDCDSHEKTQKAGDLPMTHVSIGSACIDTSSSHYRQSMGRASLGRRLLGALTAHVGVSRALGGIAILAALAVGLLLSSAGPLQAQEDSTIEYPENGTGPVAVFTATDPEIAGAVTWSLKDDVTTDDDEDFKIDKAGGVLSFMKPPNYEMATGGGSTGSSNTYSVMVIATDADGMMSEKAVTVEVTNVDEAGSVALDKVAPYPGVPLTAKLSDPDEVVSGSDEWQWSRSMSKSGSYADIEDAEAAMYLPTSGDVGYYLRATVTYKDGEGDGKSAMATSAHEVQAINSPNAAPAFPDQDPDTADVQNTEATRMVGENADAGANVGAPVAAEDGDSDILTYTLDDGIPAKSFEIDAATGQITVGAETELDFETDPSYTVMVTATDPAGLFAPAITVTISVSDDANEPPAITSADPVPPSFNEGTEAEPLTEGALTVVTFTATDPDVDNDDNETITWSLGGPDAGDFTIVGGDLTFRESPNYEMPADADGDNVYEVTVAASDADSNRGEKSVEVKVTNVDEPGVVTLSAVQPRVGVSLTASLTDPDGGVSDLKWQWSNGPDIDGATSDTYTPASDDVGDTLKATAMYTDAHGADKTAEGDAAKAVAADTRNKAPEFADQDGDTEGTQNTEAERTIAENAAAETALNGGEPFAATDPNEGDDLTYTLGGPDASSFEVSSADADEGKITVGAGTKLDYETKQTYTVTVIATDSFGASASIDVTIMVTDENEGPAITGAAEAEYAENGEGQVAVFTAVDPEDMGAVVWSLGGDDADDDADDFEIDKSSGVLSFKKSPNYEGATGGGASGTSSTYSVTVIATDADGVASEKEVTVEVTNVDEDGSVTLDKVAPYPASELTAEVSDPDEVVSGSDEWQWSRSMSKSGSYPDIEDAEAAGYTPTSDDVGYYLRATVTYKDREGDGKSAMATSANKVQGINEPNAVPAFPDQDPDTAGVQNTETTRMVGENADAGANVGAPFVAEDDDSDILTYTLGGTNVGDFEIDAATGQITVGAETELDFETDPSYTVMVTATDPAGLFAPAITVTISVSDDANEPPAITSADPVPPSFNEGTEAEPLTEGALTVVTFTATDPDVDNDDNETITWSLGGPDAGDFTIVGGDLTFRESPNYEMPADADGDNVYEVTVAASDADSNRGEKSVEVKVTNVDEPGVVTLSAVQPRVGVSLTASLTDPDGGVSDLKWQWSNGPDIDGATSDTYTPASDDVGDTLKATASYTDAQGSEKMADFVYPVGVAADTRNRAPEFPDQDDEMEGTQNTEAERTIAEDADARASVNGGLVTATDPNADDELTYTLGGPDASSFEVGSVDAAEGQITVGTGTKLDFETKQTYMVTVIATDSFGESATIDVTITVTDVNEGPVIMLGGLAVSGLRSINYDEKGTGPVATYTATGPDAAMATWTLSGDDAGAFTITITGGVLAFRSVPDYENPKDMGGDNMYQVTVEADDGTDMDSRDVTVRVMDVDEAIVGDTLLDRYDVDKDGLQKSEVLKAINDYLFGVGVDAISKADVLKLINIYLFE